MKTKKKKKSSFELKEVVLPIIAALLVLFSAMIDPTISTALAAIFIVIFIIYKTVSREGR